MQYNVDHLTNHPFRFPAILELPFLLSFLRGRRDRERSAVHWIPFRCLHASGFLYPLTDDRY